MARPRGQPPTREGGALAPVSMTGDNVPMLKNRKSLIGIQLSFGLLASGWPCLIVYLFDTFDLIDGGTYK